MFREINACRTHARVQRSSFTRLTPQTRLPFCLAKSLSFRFRRMVLVVGGVVLQEEIPADSRSLYAAHPVYRESAAQLHSMPAKLVGPVGLLYVQQREMAATLPHDSKYSMHLDASPQTGSKKTSTNKQLFRWIRMTALPRPTFVLFRAYFFFIFKLD